MSKLFSGIFRQAKAAAPTFSYGASLETLAQTANAAHEAGRGALKRGIEQYRIAGEALLSAKDQLPHGGWGEWLRLNCPQISQRQANRYMALAKLEPGSNLEEGWARLYGRAEEEAAAPALAEAMPVDPPQILPAPVSSQPLPPGVRLDGPHEAPWTETPAAEPPGMVLPPGPAERQRGTTLTFTHHDCEISCHWGRRAEMHEAVEALERALEQARQALPLPRLAA